VHDFRIAAAFVSLPRSRVVDQNMPHHARRNREELRPVLPAGGIDRRQAHVGFVDERRALERMARALAPHLTAGHRV
jgi:hypothetical protein